MTIDEAIKEIEDSYNLLGMSDYVDLDALKVAVEVMRDYQHLVHVNERLLHENKLAFEERNKYMKIAVESVTMKAPTINVTITKEQAENLGIKIE